MEQLIIYYRSRIINNRNNVENIRDNIMATRAHCSLTDEKYNLTLARKYYNNELENVAWIFRKLLFMNYIYIFSGKNSWFFHNKAIVENKKSARRAYFCCGYLRLNCRQDVQKD